LEIIERRRTEPFGETMGKASVCAMGMGL